MRGHTEQLLWVRLYPEQPDREKCIAGGERATQQLSWDSVFRAWKKSEMRAFWYFNAGNTITEEGFSLFSWERLKLGWLEPWTCSSVSFPRNSNYSTSTDTSSNDICHYIHAYYKPGTLPSSISWVAPLCQVLFCWPKLIGWVWSLGNPTLQLGEARAHTSKLTEKEQR